MRCRAILLRSPKFELHNRKFQNFSPEVEFMELLSLILLNCEFPFSEMKTSSTELGSFNNEMVEFDFQLE